MDHYTRSFPTDAQQAPVTGDRDLPRRRSPYQA